MTLDNETPVNFIIRAFTPGGWQVSVGVTPDALGSSAGTIAEGLDNWLAINGFLQTLPGLEPGEDKATIEYVMLRNHKDKDSGEVTPVIAFYAEGGLEFKYAHLYLNSFEDKDQFEKQSGVSLHSMPVWASNQYPAKTDDSFHQFAVKVATSFDMVKKQVGTRENNMPKNEYRYFKPVELTPVQPQPTVVKVAENGTESDDGGNQNGWYTPARVATLVETFRKEYHSNFGAREVGLLVGIEDAANAGLWNSYASGADAMADIRAEANKPGAITRIAEKVQQPSTMDELVQIAAADSAGPKA